MPDRVHVADPLLVRPPLPLTMPESVPPFEPAPVSVSRKALLLIALAMFSAPVPVSVNDAAAPSLRLIVESKVCVLSSCWSIPDAPSVSVLPLELPNV